MMTEIITNYHWRDLLYFHELTSDQQAWVRKEHDWVDSSDTVTWEDVQFFEYKGWIYTLDDFMRIEHHPDSEFSSWDSYSGDTYFSGVLIRFPDSEDYEHDEKIQIATYYS